MGEKIWKDRKRILGLPIGLTAYSLDSGRLYVRHGLLNILEDEIQLFRVRDFRVEFNLLDRLFGVGDITLKSSDATLPQCKLEKIKDPTAVKELLYEAVAQARKQHGVRSREYMDYEDDGGEAV